MSSIECHEKKHQPSIWKPSDSNFWVKICLAPEESIFQVEWLIATLIIFTFSSRSTNLSKKIDIRAMGEARKEGGVDSLYCRNFKYIFLPWWAEKFGDQKICAGDQI